jgi:hypothetical protein
MAFAIFWLTTYCASLFAFSFAAMYDRIVGAIIQDITPKMVTAKMTSQTVKPRWYR